MYFECKNKASVSATDNLANMLHIAERIEDARHRPLGTLMQGGYRASEQRPDKNNLDGF
jgi:methanogenic corrinoid protein MtbC1